MSISRIELLQRQQLMNRALLGVDLLGERLLSLLEEFKQLVRELSVSFEELADVDANAMINLGIALATEGEAIWDLAEGTEKNIRINVERVKIYGVDIPKLPSYELGEERPEQPLSVSSSVDYTIKNFHELYISYLNYIDQVIILHRLGNEIKRTRRQIMVLENDIIPELMSSISNIELVLEEREREEQVRLRRFKATKGRSF